jgi:hypothetical protein
MINTYLVNTHIFFLKHEITRYFPHGSRHGAAHPDAERPPALPSWWPAVVVGLLILVTPF